MKFIRFLGRNTCFTHLHIFRDFLRMVYHNIVRKGETLCNVEGGDGVSQQDYHYSGFIFSHSSYGKEGFGVFARHML